MSDLNLITPELENIDVHENSAELTLWVSEELDYFKGHFPQQAILAGVVQLDWAVKYGLAHLPLASTEVNRVEVLKFQVVIRPQTRLTLHLEAKNSTKFTFKYQSKDGVHASGRVVLNDA